MQAKSGKSSLIIVVFTAMIMIVACVAVFFFLRNHTSKAELDKKYYGKVEVTDIDTEDYNRLIRTGSSFVVVTDTPGCTSTAKLRENFEQLPENRQIKYYHIYWKDTKDTNLREAVKFAPSIAIVHSGKVIASLGADNDEDAAAFNDSASLAKWLEEYIIFP